MSSGSSSTSSSSTISTTSAAIIALACAGAVAMPRTNTSTIIAIISTTALVCTQWSNIPEWMKGGGRRMVQDQGGTSTTNNRSRGVDIINIKDANDDLATPTAVLAKLQGMFDILRQVDAEAVGSSTRSSTEEGVRDRSNSWSSTPNDDNKNETTTVMSEVQMMAAMYSLNHLNSELCAKDPDYRNKQYEDICGHHKDRIHENVEVDELKELAEYLEYAHWAYEQSFNTMMQHCSQAGLDLITHDTQTEPGRIGHYIALNHESKLAIIGLKGTSTLSDVLTDLIAIPKEHTECHFDNETFAAPTPSTSSSANKELPAASPIWFHEGIFTASTWMADKLQPMIENLLLPLKYKIVLCGHSLGAGTACLLGLELRSRIPAFRENYTDLRVLAFATPPVMSYKASKACAPFVTSVVNNADIVTRSSVAILVVMNKLLLKVHEKLQAKGLALALDSWTSMKNFYAEHSRIDDDLLMTEQELDVFFDETHGEVEQQDFDALYVPGRVVLLWDKGDHENHEAGGIVTDGGMKMLRQIELTMTCVTDHSVKAYRENLTKLIEQLDNTI